MERQQYARSDSESSGIGSEIGDLLIWRFPQDESHSDWRVVINTPSPVDGSPTEIEYNLHKNLIGLGPFKSEYFESLFRQQSQSSVDRTPPLQEAHTSTSFIELDAHSAGCFSVLLDFVYSRGVVREFHKSNAASVKHLASYFGVKRLTKAIQTFIDHDMQELTCITYLQGAEAYHDATLFDASKEMCAQHFEQLIAKDILSLPPSLFLDVVTCDQLKCGSQELSCKVSEYCKAHEDLITADWLERVTSASLLPQIFPSEGIYFLLLGVRYFEGPQGSSLRSRCLSCISEYWTEVLLLDDENFCRLPGDVQVDVLKAALETAGKELETSVSELSLARSRHRVSQRAVEALKVELQESRTIHSERAQKCEDLESELEESRKRIVSLEKEVRECRNNPSQLSSA